MISSYSYWQLTLSSIGVTFAWLSMRKEIKYEFFPATTSTTCHALINGWKRCMGKSLLPPYHQFHSLLFPLLFFLLMLLFFCSSADAYRVCPLCRGDVREGFTGVCVSNPEITSLWENCIYTHVNKVALAIFTSSSSVYTFCILSSEAVA